MYIGETAEWGQPTAAQINYVIIQTLSKNQRFTDLCAVNKRLTRIISNGSLIINPFVWHVWIHWDCKTSAKHPGAVGVSKRSKVALLRVIKECTAWTHPFSSSSFLFWSTRFVGPRFDKWIPKPCTSWSASWSDFAYNGFWSGYYWLLLFFFVVVDCRNTRVQFKVDFTVKISNAPLALDKIGQCLKFKQSDQILKHWKLQNRPWRRTFLLDLIRSMKVVSFRLSCFPPASRLYKTGISCS